jgi:photosystem II stability/assembly factor-like uncharacterized protein
LKTTNEGLNWSNWSTEMNLTTADIHFFNNNTGVAVGENGATGIIKRTTDSGISWQLQHSSEFNPQWCVKFVNSTTGYAGGSNNSVLKSTDGGLSWFPQNSGINVGITSIFFLNESMGFAAGQNKIFKTSNGGNNWTEQFNRNGWGFNSIAFTGSTGIALNGYAKILRTIDSGNTWDSISIGNQNNLKSVVFLNNNDVFIVGGTNYMNNAVILRSTNSGLNWIIQDSFSKDNLITLTTSDSNTLFTGGEFGKLLKYTNGNSNWVSVSAGFSNGMNDVQFFNSNTGYALRNKHFYDNNTGIIKTTNGGYNWSFYPINAGSTILQAMSFVNELTGFVVGWANGSGYTTFRTSNGGVNWSNFNPGNNSNLQDVCFINSNTGFVVGTIYIRKTTNSGLNWSLQTLSYNLNGISFPSVDTGYIVSEPGSVLKTTNCGENWIIKSTLPYGLRCIYFINNNTGWVAAGRIYKTTNGGDNWQIQYNFTPGGFNSMTWVDQNKGYGVSGNGAIYYSDNGGANWYTQKSYTGGWLTTVDFVDQNTGWIVGYDGIILHTTDGGLTTLFESINNIPIAFSLSQNYPNPFNPMTNIRFELPKSGFVELTIYDINGREITKLVQQQMNAGSYSVDWDASYHASGVYFYKLKTEELIETRKMVLLK